MSNPLYQLLNRLEQKGELLRIKEEVDPELLMASMQLIAYAHNGPVLFFEKVKGSRYPAVSNLFGSIDRSKYIFNKQWKKVQSLINIRNNPEQAIKRPFNYLNLAGAALNSLPKKVKWKSDAFDEINIEDLPLIKCWPKDAGAFVLLPQVYSEDIEKPGIMNGNLGMYRIQLTGNAYRLNEEVGLHYQIHRGIGIHHKKALENKQPLKVSIFIGGHPAHAVAAVMPLPEGLSELTFAGLLAGRRFRYAYDDYGNMVSMDADFVITGEIAEDLKPEGPFGDHLGYYSLTHLFPYLKVKKVYAKKDAIWPFTVVGRPPQEDTSFGALIHELTGNAIKVEIPGVEAVHAVDCAGVHPLLFAIGSERYTPFSQLDQPAELLTQANRVLGTGQLSLAKFLFITAPHEQEYIDIHNEASFLEYILERVEWKRDLHFHTCTTIDTLDYSGVSINNGSKVTIAAYGRPIRILAQSIKKFCLEGFETQMITSGILAVATVGFSSYDYSMKEFANLEKQLLDLYSDQELEQIPLIIWCDDVEFISKRYDNFLWATFTRSNPAQDIYGVGSFIKDKHFGCTGPLVIDARKKPHHAPELVPGLGAEEQALAVLKRAGWEPKV